MSWTIDEHIGEMRPWPEKVIVHRGETDEALCYRPVTECGRCKHCTAASGSTTHETLYECHGPLVPGWDYYNDEPAHTYVPADGFCMYGTPKTDGDDESEMR